jgi:HEPN domain-containing protein
MPSERFPPDDPREWLNRARSNLVYAKAKTRGVYYEDLCFQAQQAAEKAFKAVCLKYAIPFPRTHNLVDLIRLLEERGVSVPAPVRESGRLTDYAVEARYPGPAEPVTEEEYNVAIAQCEGVVAWAAGLLESQ